MQRKAMICTPHNVSTLMRRFGKTTGPHGLYLWALVLATCACVSGPRLPSLRAVAASPSGENEGLFVAVVQAAGRFNTDSLRSNGAPRFPLSVDPDPLVPNAGDITPKNRVSRADEARQARRHLLANLSIPTADAIPPKGRCRNWSGYVPSEQIDCPASPNAVVAIALTDPAKSSRHGDTVTVRAIVLYSGPDGWGESGYDYFVVRSEGDWTVLTRVPVNLFPDTCCELRFVSQLGS